MIKTDENVHVRHSTMPKYPTKIKATVKNHLKKSCILFGGEHLVMSSLREAVESYECGSLDSGLSMAKTFFEIAS